MTAISSASPPAAAGETRRATWARRLTAAAATLDERPSLLPAARHDPQAELRLERWCHRIALGRGELFDRRLAWDGLDRAAARRRVVDAAPPAAPAAWATTLADVLATAEDGEPPLARRAALAGLLFGEVLWPFARHAAIELDRRWPRRRWMLGDEVVATLLARHAGYLGEVAGEALAAELATLRDAGEGSLDRLLREHGDAPSDVSYRAFVARCRGPHGAWDGLAAILERYPVLARQLVTVTDDWVDATGELAERLVTDAGELATVFGGGGALGAVREVQSGLSDRHAGGRSVAVVSFADGTRIVYKPKPLDVDAAFFRLLAWIGRRGDLDDPAELGDFRIPRLLPREGYGWMEWIAPEPTTATAGDEAPIARFYRRSGHLLALVYALEGYDCHAENLIAAGEQPVLVDLETLLSPSAAGLIDDAGISPATATAARQLFDSVLRSGLLPSWTRGDDDARLDISGLGGDPGQRRLTAVPVWRGLGTDALRRERVRTVMPPCRNLPRRQDGEVVSCDAYQGEVVVGFAAMYGFLLRHRDELLADPELLPSWRRLRVRYVLRQTRHYGTLLRRLLAPRLLADGREWSFAAESLCRLWLFVGERPAGWELFRHERAALLRLDVPYFAARADRRDVLSASGEVVLAERFAETPFERLERRLATLSAADLAHQVSYIRASFLARATGRPSPAVRRLPEVEWTSVPPITVERARDLAMAVGDELIRGAVRDGGDGPGSTASWIALEPHQDTAVCSLRPVGLTLHSGSAGIALFLAALARTTGDGAARQTATAALSELAATVEGSATRLLTAVGLGANLGLGSVIYALTAAAELLGERRWARVAVAAATAIDEELVAADGKHDVVFGAAGALLALAALHDATGDEGVLAAARRCGDHLVAAFAPTPQGPPSCPTMDGGFHTGFSHGAAGVACALHRLATITGDAVYRQRARQATAWEESLYDPAAGNYPDLRSSAGEPAFMAAWCHGAPGIALARLADHRVTRSRAARAQARRALAATVAAGAADADHLCCGNAGRIAILAAGARSLGDPALADRARRLATWSADRAAAEGGFRLPAGLLTSALTPGLFTGLAGIGWALLDLACPGVLPALLVFDRLPILDSTSTKGTP